MPENSVVFAHPHWFNRLAFMTATAIILLGCFQTANPVHAQDEPTVAEDPPAGLMQGLPSDRKTIAAIESIRDDIAAGAFSSGVNELRRVLTADAGLLVPSETDETTFIPLHSAVFQVWKNLPADRRLALSRPNELLANRALESILAESRLKEIPEFLVRYVGTTAALQAHLVVGRLHLDRGNVRAASVWLSPLDHESIEPEIRMAAVRALADIRETNQRSDADGTAIASAEAAASDVNLPRHLVWQQRPLTSPQLRLQLEKFSKAARKSGFVLQTSWAEQKPESTAFRKTLRGVSAIDVRTGTTLWRYSLSPDLDAAVTKDASNNGVFQKLKTESISEETFASLDTTAVANTFCRNEVLSRISWDRERLYVIGSDSVGSLSSRRVGGVFINSSRLRSSGGDVRLIALEKSTGRRVWTVAAGSLQDEAFAASDDLWIAGPPSVSRSNLYAVVERNGEIFLTCLKPETGELIWKRLLAFPEQEIEKDPVRQFRGAQPLVKSGLIWCLTTTDRVVCVDELTHGFVWAGHLPSNTELQSRYTASRGRPVNLTAAAPLHRRWARSELIYHGETLVVMSPQSHEIFRFDSGTGQPLKSLPVNSTAGILYADGSNLLIGESRRLYLMDTAAATPIWSVALPDDVEAPTGRALLANGRFFVPLCSGDMLSLNSADGQQLETSDRILPPGPWGQLFSVNDGSGDLLYAAPERLLRLSATASGEPAKHVVEVVAGLMSAGRWQDALELIGQVDVDDENYNEVLALKFECLLQVSLNSDDVDLAALKASAKTDVQETQVRVLEVSTLIRSGQFREAAVELMAILSLQSGRLATLIPAFNASAGPPKEGRSVVMMQALGTWAGNALSQLLPMLRDDLALRDQLQKLPSLALLTIRDSSIRPYLCAAAKNEPSAETSMHLLRHSLSLASPADSGIAEEIEILSSFLARLKAADSGGIGVGADAIIEVAALEFSTEIWNSLRKDGDERLSTQQQLQEEFRKSMTLRSEQWTPQEFHAVPVTRNTSSFSRNSVMLSIADTDDPFLRRFDWSARRSDFGRLVASSHVEQWSIPGQFKVHGNYTTRSDTLYRTGTVLLLRSNNSLSAVSILDRRFLWGRDFAVEKRGAESATKSAAESGNFSQYDRAQHPAHSQAMSPPGSVRLAGSGDRWVCIQSENSVELIDVLSGHTLWSLALPESGHDVIASDRLVFVRQPGGGTLCFDTLTGEAVDAGLANELLATTIRCVGTQIVRWQSGEKGAPNALEWIDAKTGAVDRRVLLKGTTHYRFLDDRTLVGLGGQKELMVVDMMTGDVETADFRLDSNNSALSGSANGGFSEEGSWDPIRIQVSADALNYYVTVSPKELPDQAIPQPNGRGLTCFEGELRAVNRMTGKLRWRVAVDGQQVVVTDQPALPVMILIATDSVPTNVANRSLSRHEFRAVHKLSGDILFNQVVPSSYGLRYFDVQAPKANVLDISVYGNQLRVSGTDVDVDLD